MGASLPKYLEKAEICKQTPYDGVFSYKKTNLRDSPENSPWVRASIRVFRCKITITESESSFVLNIDRYFFIIYHENVGREIVFGHIDENLLIAVIAENFRQFFDFFNVLTQSKIPTWQVSPVCQVCGASTSSKKNQNCCNCGSCICKRCFAREKMVISQELPPQKVCVVCEEIIKQQGAIIMSYNKGENLPSNRASDIYK